MAVTANDIALGCFFEDPRQAGATRHLAHETPLRLFRAMIELHDVRREPTSAVGARNVLQLLNELDLRAPPRALLIQARR